MNLNKMHLCKTRKSRLSTTGAGGGGESTGRLGCANGDFIWFVVVTMLVGYVKVRGRNKFICKWIKIAHR